MPRRALAHLAFLVLSLGVLAPAHAQAQPTTEVEIGVAPGERIRVTMASALPSDGDGPTLVGHLVGSDRNEVRLALSSSEIRALRRDAIAGLERSVRPSRKSRGALIGFAVGLAAAVGKAALQGGCNDGCNEANVAGAVLLGLSTAVVGAVAAPGEVWAEVPLERGPGPDGDAATRWVAGATGPSGRAANRARRRHELLTDSPRRPRRQLQARCGQLRPTARSAG